MKNRKKIHDDWKTPKYLFPIINEKLEYINGEYIENWFDPCPINSNFNGLEINWELFNYCNPPYNRKDKEAFIKKARKEQLKGNTTLMLLPVSTSTKIFHEVILPNAEVEFIKGRIKFIGINSKGEKVSNKCGQHDSMFVLFKGAGENNNV